MHLPVSAEKAHGLVDNEDLQKQWINAQSGIADAMKRVAEAKQNLHEYLSESGLGGTLDLPRKIIERDANGKAMRWLPEVPPRTPENCSTSDPVAWTAPGVLRHSVKSYRASVGETRRAKGKSK